MNEVDERLSVCANRNDYTLYLSSFFFSLLCDSSSLKDPNSSSLLT